MNSQWIQVKKWFRGGTKEEYICLVQEDDITQDDIDEYAKEWGELSTGGHSGGYRLEWDVVDCKDVSSKNKLNVINKINREIEYTKESIKELQSKLKTISEDIENN